MKTFEERYTAWVDGKLSDSDRAAFEAELSQRDVEDRLEVHKLGALLRTAQAPPLSHAEFFNHQLMARIDAERTPSERTKRRSWFFSPFGRLAAFGALSLFVAGAL